MPRIFLGNFDFEHELAGANSVGDALGVTRHGRSRAGKARSDLAWVWTAIAEAEDIVLTDGEISAADFEALSRLGLPIPRFCNLAEPVPTGAAWQLVPWGWTESLVQLAKEQGWTCVAPPVEIARRVNSREFRFGLERDWNIGLDSAALVHSIDDLEVVIRNSGDNSLGWLLKANYGMAGREAIRGRGKSLEDNARNWAQKRLAESGPVVFEPIVARVAEAGIQIEIRQTGMPELVGITPLLVGGNGVYRGSRFGCPAEELADWQPAVDVGLRTATELQRLGYFGPLGIDAMQYRDAGGDVRLRPLQDLNARYTMGRLALGFCRVLARNVTCAGESMNIVTSPPPPPPYEGVEKGARRTEAAPAACGSDADDKRCGTWLHFNERQVAGREWGEWIVALQSKLPRGALAVPASPFNSLSPHRSVLVLAKTPELRDVAEKVVDDALPH